MQVAQIKLKTATEGTTAHGLSRIVSTKPLFIRVVWFLLFLLFMCFFCRGLYGFVVKLQSRQVTSSLEAGSVTFRFPDVYACFENPMSGTYANTLDNVTVAQFNARINNITIEIHRLLRLSFPNSTTEEGIKMALDSQTKYFSSYYVPSLPYHMLVDALAHREEQSVLSSGVFGANEVGMFAESPIAVNSFYHPTLLRCFCWTAANSTHLRDIKQGDSLIVTLFLDANDKAVSQSLGGNTVQSPVYLPFISRTDGSSAWRQVPVSEWTLTPAELYKPDRRSGARIFLMPPREYPTDFGSSYLLAPGMHHQIEVSMQEEVHNSEQFNCINNGKNILFFNPYDDSPYSHEYSYSYCYYHEYNRIAQYEMNLSVPTTPITWPLRSARYMTNVSGTPNILSILVANTNGASFKTSNFDALARAACENRKRCSNLIYDARVSSSAWPTQASLSAFISVELGKKMDEAIRNKLSVPALDYLTNASNSATGELSAEAANYAQRNLMKLEIRPRRMDCDRLRFSIDYGLENFVADIGGIMGIYLGMSLLTICELFELVAEIIYFTQACCARKTKVTNITDEMNEQGRGNTAMEVAESDAAGTKVEVLESEGGKTNN